MKRVASESPLRPLALARPLLLASVAMLLSLAAAPGFARTSPIPADPVCIEADCADAEASSSDTQKSAGGDKRAAPSATRPAKPGNTRANGLRKPRWHRYLPGMYR